MHQLNLLTQQHQAAAPKGSNHMHQLNLLSQQRQAAASKGPVHWERIELHSSGDGVIVESPAMSRQGLITEQGADRFRR
ncbi:hypothetical protein [uncultured Bifidobacterium sp.]|uniref:hypothetical protein n=1 Tax=uncultured Bifidobacterium sp. TaxID=165187 RepID=UPI00258FD314|nr:hypothetical protein [uncultured Bifidobacterium sp.]